MEIGGFHVSQYCAVYGWEREHGIIPHPGHDVDRK